MLCAVLKHKLRYVFVVALEMCLLVDVCNTRPWHSIAAIILSFLPAQTPFTAHPSALRVLADECLLPLLLRYAVAARRNHYLLIFQNVHNNDDHYSDPV